MPHYCAYCGASAAHICTGCEATWYCCAECQRRDWSENKHWLLCNVVVLTQADADEDVDEYELEELLEELEKAGEEEESVDTKLVGKTRRRRSRTVRLSRAKARKILHDGSVRGHPLTPKQRRYFGWIAGGGKRRR